MVLGEMALEDHDLADIQWGDRLIKQGLQVCVGVSVHEPGPRNQDLHIGVFDMLLNVDSI